MTIQKIDSLLTNSLVNLYKDEKLNIFTFNIEYVNQNQDKVKAELNEIEELRNKILMSSTNTNLHFLRILENKSSVNNNTFFLLRINNILFTATGALMSTMSLQQGESIPSIAHLIHIQRMKE